MTAAEAIKPFKKRPVADEMAWIQRMAIADGVVPTAPQM